MKVKLTKEQVEEIVNDPQKAADAKIKISDPWWVVLLKVVAYAIGLILAGSATSCAAAAAYAVL